MKRFFFLASLVLWMVPCPDVRLNAQEMPRIQQEITVEWRVVPLFAFGREGKPLAGLTERDIEIYAGRKRVDSFRLVRKEAQLEEARNEASTGGTESGFVPRRKLMFLIFDNAMTSGSVMNRAKKIAAAMLNQPGETSQYIVMTIEPFGGLTHVIGPDASREAIVKAIRRAVSGKKNEFSGNQSLGADIRETMPTRDAFGYENPIGSNDRFESEAKNIEKNESFDSRRSSSSFQASFEPLTAILGAFQESGKVVYLFSSGVPSKISGRKREYQIQDNKLETVQPDDLYYKGMLTLASIFARNGVLLFLVNPSGSRLKAEDPESGEKSLRMIADESGGRYYSGTEKEVTGELVAMEQSYYEVYFADPTETKESEFEFEIVCNKPDTSIYTVKRLTRGREYAEMSQLEREVLILDAVRRGYLSRVKLKIIPFSLDGSAGKIRIPDGLPGSEWDLYRVWIEKKGTDVKMERERLTVRTPEVVLDIKPRKGYRRHVVLVHSGTGTAFVGSE